MATFRNTIGAVLAVALLAALPATAAARHGRHHGDRHRGQQSVAGTIASFNGARLTIRLAGGSTVSGTVNRRTEIECESAAPSARMADHHGDIGSGDRSGRDESRGSSGDDGRGRNDQNEANENEAAEPADQNEAAENEAAEPGEQSAPGMCGTDPLTPGTTVTRARLRLRRGAGAVFTQIKLAR